MATALDAAPDPPLRVLADPELFRNVVSFLSGKPFVVAQYIAFVKHKRPTYDQEFWQHAVCCGDRATLRSLRAHSRQPIHSQDAFSRCDAIMGFAVALFAEQQSRGLLQRVYALVRSPAERRLDRSLLDWLAATFTNEHHRRCYFLQVHAIAEHGSVELVQWVLERQLACGVSLMDTAARFGRMDLVQLLHKRNAEGCCSTSAMDHAASEGHFEIVKFLHENRSEGCTASAMDGAAASGHLAILRFLHEHRSEGCSHAAMTFSAGRGHLACVRYFHGQNLPGFTADAMSYAGTNGHLNVVKFLHENRSEGCTSWTLLEASKRGHHAVVDFLCANRPMQNPDWLLWRAKYEHLGRLVASLERMQAATTSTTQLYEY